MPPRLITPDLITATCIDVLGRRHPEHLAALERDRGLPARKIERLATVDELTGEGNRQRGDQLPAVLIGTFGTANTPTVTSRRKVTFEWAIAAEVWVFGTNRADTLRRRDWYALTVAECLLQRLPRHAEPVDALELLDIDFAAGAGKVGGREGSLAHAQLLFSVLTRDAIDLDGLPTDDSTLPPGSPGGPPGDTYTPPVPWPQVADAHTQIDKEPL